PVLPWDSEPYATRYTPFGDWRTEPTAGLTDIGYTGHRHNNLADKDLGMVYMQARYYVPWMIWLSFLLRIRCQTRCCNQLCRQHCGLQAKHAAQLHYLPLQHEGGGVLGGNRGHQAVDHQALRLGQRLLRARMPLFIWVRLQQRRLLNIGGRQAAAQAQGV